MKRDWKKKSLPGAVIPPWNNKEPFGWGKPQKKEQNHSPPVLSRAEILLGEWGAAERGMERRRRSWKAWRSVTGKALFNPKEHGGGEGDKNKIFIFWPIHSL